MRKLVYIVDDEPLQLHFLSMTLGNMGFAVEPFHSPKELLSALDKRLPNAVVIDLIMPEMSGIELITEIRKRTKRIPLVAVTAYPEIETAMSAVRAGANDYLKKPYEKAELQFVVRRLIEFTQIRENYSNLLDKETSRFSGESFIGSSPAMQETRMTLERLSGIPDSTILLTGQPGTGKSFAARILHYGRPDLMSRLIEVNCAALTEKELIAELFGPDGNAEQVTGPDLFSLSEGGTLILEALPAMGQSVQKFLVERLRREQTGKAVLSPWEARRIIATSQMELDELVKNGTLLPSLAEHFNVLTLRMPSLSEREKDVLELARHFVSTTNSDHIPPLKGLTVGAEHVLMSYDWPGNVRELRSVIERAVSVSQGPYITADDLRMRSVAAHAEEMTGEEPLSSLKEIEVRQIRRVLAFTEGDITRAAAILGISRKSLWERRKRYSIS